jgi:hypothetical protein
MIVPRCTIVLVQKLAIHKLFHIKQKKEKKKKEKKKELYPFNISHLFQSCIQSKFFSLWRQN